jgi:hypothetical protein
MQSSRGLCPKSSPRLRSPAIAILAIVTMVTAVVAPTASAPATVLLLVSYRSRLMLRFSGKTGQNQTLSWSNAHHTIECFGTPAIVYEVYVVSEDTADSCSGRNHESVPSLGIVNGVMASVQNGLVGSHGWPSHNWPSHGLVNHMLLLSRKRPLLPWQLL